jgi:DNA-directed RNA polymerase specialized sigma24 family protein
MSIHIDPKALNAFADQAGTHARELHNVHLNLDLPADTLGTFDEATELVGAINAHTGEVNQRLQATSDALLGLARAAAQAATLSHASDADIAKKMKTINGQIDDARRKLVAPRV